MAAIVVGIEPCGTPSGTVTPCATLSHRPRPTLLVHRLRTRAGAPTECGRGCPGTPGGGSRPIRSRTGRRPAPGAGRCSTTRAAAASVRTRRTYSAGAAPQVGPEQPAEVPLADAGKIGEDGRREVAVKVLGDVLDDVAHDVVRRRRRCDVHAHLGLCPRALHVGDQRPGHPPRDVGTVVLGDERQGEVQSARHPGRRRDVAVADEDRIRVDGDVPGARGRAGRRTPSAWWRGGRRAARPRPAPSPRCTPTPPGARRRASRRTCATSTSSAAARRWPWPPTTTSVSTGPAHRSSAPCASSRSPGRAVTGRAARGEQADVVAGVRVGQELVWPSTASW